MVKKIVERKLKRRVKMRESEERIGREGGEIILIELEEERDKKELLEKKGEIKRK